MSWLEGSAMLQHGVLIISSQTMAHVEESVGEQGRRTFTTLASWTKEGLYPKGRTNLQHLHTWEAQGLADYKCWRRSIWWQLWWCRIVVKWWWHSSTPSSASECAQETIEAVFRCLFFLHYCTIVSCPSFLTIPAVFLRLGEKSRPWRGMFQC